MEDTEKLTAKEKRIRLAVDAHGSWVENYLNSHTGVVRVCDLYVALTPLLKDNPTWPKLGYAALERVLTERGFILDDKWGGRYASMAEITRKQ